jgi:hypothetical protein
MSAKVTITKVDESLSTAEGRAARAAEEARTPNRINAPVDITADGQYREFDEVKIVVYRDQAAKLVELLDRHIDLDVVRLDNDDPEGAMFVGDLVKALRDSLESTR